MRLVTVRRLEGTRSRTYPIDARERAQCSRSLMPMPDDAMLTHETN